MVRGLVLLCYGDEEGEIDARRRLIAARHSHHLAPLSARTVVYMRNCPPPTRGERATLAVAPLHSTLDCRTLQPHLINIM